MTCMGFSILPTFYLLSLILSEILYLLKYIYFNLGILFISPAIYSYNFVKKKYALALSAIMY
jgi:hypothetical protein